MDAFVTLIGRASVQGALAVLAVWAVCRLFPRLPASLRCGLWWLACLKLVVGLVWATPVPLPVLPPAERPAMTVLTTVPLAETGTIAVPPQAPIGEPSRFPWALVLLGLWGAGLAGHLAWTAVQLRRARAVIREAEPVEERWVVDLFAELRGELRVSPRAEVLAAEVETPQVLGLFRPRVLLPRRALSRLSPAELAMTLCHELLHVRRGDLWLGWVPALAQRLFFFHPLARLAVREYALAREAACDAEVLRVLDPAPDAYGQLLLRLGVAPRVPRLAAAGAAPSFETLKRRLMMLQQASDKKRIHPAWWGLVVLVALVGLIPFQMVAQEPGEAAPVAAVEPADPVEAVEPVSEVAPVPSVEPAPEALPTPEGVPAPAALPAVASTPGVRIMPGAATMPAVAGVPAVPGVATMPVAGVRIEAAVPGTPAPVAKMAAVHASPPAPPAPPVPPAPPAAPRSRHSSWRSGNGDAYVVQLSRDRHIMSGSSSDLEKADKLLGGPGIWFERNGKDYVIRDAATVRQVEELFKPQMELGKRQAELGSQQAGLGQKQAQFGAQQAELGARMAGLGAKQASLAAEQASRGDEEDASLEAKMEELSGQMEELGRQMEKLSEPMEELGRQQGALGEQQGELGEQQAKLAEQAEKQLRTLLDKAIASGLAQEVK